MASTRAFSKRGLDRLHTILAKHVESGGVPGMVAAVSRRGETHVDVLGDTTRDAIFRISSMSKPITAVATMILLEECVLRLDDPVDNFLPELGDLRVLKAIDGPVDDTVPANRKITTRDLLTFRMGTGGYFGDIPYNEAAAKLELSMGPPQPQLIPAPDEWMRRFATLPLMFQPGERWMYHIPAMVLSVLIARASGQPFGDFLRERIFDPLDMKDTAFFVPAEKLDRLGNLYSRFEDGTLELYDAPDGQWSRPPAFPNGGDGLVSTADDYLAFAQMLLRGGAPILSRPSVETMTTDHLTDEQKRISGFNPPHDFDGHGWGFGVGVVTRRDAPSAPVGQYGWSGGMGTIWGNAPSEDIVTILMTTASFSSPQMPAYARDFLTAAYAAIDD